MPNPPDPVWLIVAGIAVACVVLYPIRLWRRRTHRYGPETDESDEMPTDPGRRSSD